MAHHHKPGSSPRIHPRISQDASEQGSTLPYPPQDPTNAQGYLYPPRGGALRLGGGGGAPASFPWGATSCRMGRGAAWCGPVRRLVPASCRAQCPAVLAGAATRPPSCVHVSCWRAPRSPLLRRMYIITRIPQGAHPPPL